MKLSFEQETLLGDLDYTMKALQTLGEEASDEFASHIKTRGGEGVLYNPMPTLQHFLMIAADMVGKLQELKDDRQLAA